MKITRSWIVGALFAGCVFYPLGAMGENWVYQGEDSNWGGAQVYYDMDSVQEFYEPGLWFAKTKLVHTAASRQQVIEYRRSFGASVEGYENLAETRSDIVIDPQKMSYVLEAEQDFDTNGNVLGENKPSDWIPIEPGTSLEGLCRKLPLQ